jgi:hypothetical protein
VRSGQVCFAWPRKWPGRKDNGPRYSGLCARNVAGRACQMGDAIRRGVSVTADDVRRRPPGHQYPTSP